ncbi:AsnC family transcriptional regulator [Comamonas phosphati]|nr:AsnC family transcriptional regulator [Comamonas phosphati]
MASSSEIHALDRTDRRILDILQREGRIAITELAERVGLSASPCSERIKRMERDGVITGYHARVSPEALGKTLLVFVEIKLSSKSEEVFDKVRKELLHVPDVLECHLVSGGFDYLVKARLGGMREYRRLLGDILKKLPVPAESHSYVVMEEVKDTQILPLDR